MRDTLLIGITAAGAGVLGVLLVFTVGKNDVDSDTAYDHARAQALKAHYAGCMEGAKKYREYYEGSGPLPWDESFDQERCRIAAEGFVLEVFPKNKLELLGEE